MTPTWLKRMGRRSKYPWWVNLVAVMLGVCVAALFVIAGIAVWTLINIIRLI